MTYCNTAVTPLLMHWNNCRLLLSIVRNISLSSLFASRWVVFPPLQVLTCTGCRPFMLVPDKEEPDRNLMSTVMRLGSASMTDARLISELEAGFTLASKVRLWKASTQVCTDTVEAQARACSCACTALACSGIDGTRLASNIGCPPPSSVRVSSFRVSHINSTDSRLTRRLWRPVNRELKTALKISVEDCNEKLRRVCHIDDLDLLIMFASYHSINVAKWIQYGMYDVFTINLWLWWGQCNMILPRIAQSYCHGFCEQQLSLFHGSFSFYMIYAWTDQILYTWGHGLLISLSKFFIGLQDPCHGSCRPMKNLLNDINKPCRIKDNFQRLVKPKIL